MSKKLIPFKWLPGSWGLKGQEYEKAKARYELTGYDLDIQIAQINNTNEITGEINKKQFQLDVLEIRAKYDRVHKDNYEYEKIKILYEDIDPDTYALEKLKLDKENNYISNEEYDYAYLDLLYNEEELNYKLAKNELNYKYHKINVHDYEKIKATLNNEPWVAVIGSEYNPKDTVTTFSLQLDWNYLFIDECKKNGYHGSSEEQIAESWLEDVITEDYMHYIYELNNEAAQSENQINQGAITHERIDDSKTKHS